MGTKVIVDARVVTSSSPLLLCSACAVYLSDVIFTRTTIVDSMPDTLILVSKLSETVPRIAYRWVNISCNKP